MKNIIIAIFAAAVFMGCDRDKAAIEDSKDATQEALDNQKKAVDDAASAAKKQAEASKDAAQAQIEADKQKEDAQADADKAKVAALKSATGVAARIRLMAIHRLRIFWTPCNGVRLRLALCVPDRKGHVARHLFNSADDNCNQRELDHSGLVPASNSTTSSTNSVGSRPA
jgi:hypothetical protein